MPFKFREAVRKESALLIGISGPSGSGKTLSAIRMARGIVGDSGKIALIDTENGRALNYADNYKIDMYSEFEPPFRPLRYLEAITAAHEQGGQAIIIDSASHMHEGEGGMLEWHDQEVQRLMKAWKTSAEKVNPTAWVKPKQEFARFVTGYLRLNVHLIFCFRSKEKIGIVKDQKGKTQIVDLGFQPICPKGMDYDMLTMLSLPLRANGVPDLFHSLTKLDDQHKGFIPVGCQLDENVGKQFAKWAAGGSTPQKMSKSAGEQEPPKKSLEERRTSAISWLDGQGISAKTVCLWLGVIEVPEISDQHLVRLQEAAKRINNGEDAQLVFHVEPEAPPPPAGEMDDWTRTATEGADD